MKKSMYTENYKKVTVLSESGKTTKDEFVYIGNYYKLEAVKKSVKRVKMEMAALAVVLFLVYLGLGFIDNSGSHLFYVILPFVISFLPISFMVIATLQLVLKRELLNEFDYQRIWIRIKNTCIATLVLIFLSMIGDLVFFVLYFGSAPKTKEFYFLFGCASIIVLSLAVLRIQKQLKCIQIENANIL